MLALLSLPSSHDVYTSSRWERGGGGLQGGKGRVTGGRVARWHTIVTCAALYIIQRGVGKLLPKLFQSVSVVKGQNKTALPSSCAVGFHAVHRSTLPKPRA